MVNSRLGIATRGIFDGKQLFGESAKVVNGSGRRFDGDAGIRHIPVSRDRENGFRSWYFLANAAPRFRVGIVAQSIHGIAVTEEQCRERLRHACLQ